MTDYVPWAQLSPSPNNHPEKFLIHKCPGPFEHL